MEPERSSNQRYLLVGRGSPESLPNLFSRMKEFPFEGLDDAMLKSLAKI